MANKVTTMVLTVDLECSKCYKKVKKTLCKFPQIRDQVYDEKKNTVTIKVVSSCPEIIRDKIRCKGGVSIKNIEIKAPEQPKEPEKEEPKEPKKKKKKKKKEPCKTRPPCDRPPPCDRRPLCDRPPPCDRPPCYPPIFQPCVCFPECSDGCGRRKCKPGGRPPQCYCDECNGGPVCDSWCYMVAIGVIAAVVLIAFVKKILLA